VVVEELELQVGLEVQVLVVQVVQEHILQFQDHL
jgi:hypothetical protein